MTLAASAIQDAWPILAALAYLLITCVLTVLTSTRKNALDIHNRVRECMEIRRRYRTGDKEAEEANATVES